MSMMQLASFCSVIAILLSTMLLLGTSIGMISFYMCLCLLNSVPKLLLLFCKYITVAFNCLGTFCNTDVAFSKRIRCNISVYGLNCESFRIAFIQTKYLKFHGYFSHSKPPPSKLYVFRAHFVYKLLSKLLYIQN